MLGFLKIPSTHESDSKDAHSIGPEPEDRRLGTILLHARKLEQAALPAILTLQARKNLLFGEAAVALKLLTHGDVQWALGRQYGVVHFDLDGKIDHDKLIAATQPYSLHAEIFRTIKGKIKAHSRNARGKTLALISPHAEEGCSYVAANLAITFAQAGERTLLIDADLRSPTLAAWFRLSGDGLSGILSGRVGAEAIKTIGGNDNLAVLGAGPVPPNPAELLGRDAFVALLAELERRYDNIIIDAPPAFPYADAGGIVAHASTAALVVRRGKTYTRAAQETLAMLRLSGADVLGYIVNQ